MAWPTVAVGDGCWMFHPRTEWHMQISENGKGAVHIMHWLSVTGAMCRQVMRSGDDSLTNNLTLAAVTLTFDLLT